MKEVAVTASRPKDKLKDLKCDDPYFTEIRFPNLFSKIGDYKLEDVEFFTLFVDVDTEHKRTHCQLHINLCDGTYLSEGFSYLSEGIYRILELNKDKSKRVILCHVHDGSMLFHDDF